MREDLLPKDFTGALARLVEEAGEVLQVVGKIGRFGLSPTDPKTGLKYFNGADLEMELQDLEHAIQAVRHLIPVTDA